MKRRWLALGGAVAVACGLLVGVLLIRGGEGTDEPAKPQRAARALVSPTWIPIRKNRRSMWRMSLAPQVGGPRTVFRLTAPTADPSPRCCAGFELTGPGGPGCRGRLRAHFGLGFDIDDDAKRTGSQTRYLPPQRQEPLTPPSAPGYDRALQRQPWCPGRYRVAAFELRFNDGRPLRVLATRAFEVRRRGPRSRLRASHGVTYASIGEPIVGIPYRRLLSRLGEPKTVPPAYNRSDGMRCLYYEDVGHDADTPSYIAGIWQFCLRHGRVYSAGGSPYLVVAVRAPGSSARPRP